MQQSVPKHCSGSACIIHCVALDASGLPLDCLAKPYTLPRQHAHVVVRQLGAACICQFNTMVQADRCVCTAAASFASYVSIMSKTGVLVSRHGPMLANALFLPPGEAL